MKKETTLSKLENAFSRLKQGNPIRTKANEKLPHLQSKTKLGCLKAL